MGLSEVRVHIPTHLRRQSPPKVCVGWASSAHMAHLALGPMVAQWPGQGQRWLESQERSLMSQVREM